MFIKLILEKKKSSSLIHFSQVSTCITEIQTKGRLKNGAKIGKVQTNEKTTQKIKPLMIQESH